jgi:cell division protein FtsI/penicillin-binding protein 2
MRSSNIGAAKMGLMLSDSVYYDYVRRFGFGNKTGIAVPYEISGLVLPPSKWDQLTKTRMAFGQSVAVTPIQLTMAYCVLANGGKLMKPVIGDEKSVVVRRVCSVGTADRVKNALQKTVSDQGTAPLARVDGVEVAGKTGTAQAITPDGHYYADNFITSFAGLFPVKDPKYVMVVVVDEADLPPEKNYGGLVAAPIFADIAGKISKTGKN